MNNVIQFPGLRTWKPTPAQLKLIREYCAKVERRTPGQVVLEVGERLNLDDGRVSANLYLVTRDSGWDDTDLHDYVSWAEFRSYGVPLNHQGKAMVDFYISSRSFDGRGELLGNAQVYVETLDGKPRVVGFSATGIPFEDSRIV